MYWKRDLDDAAQQKESIERDFSLEPIGTDREGNEIQLFDIIEADDDDAQTKVALKEDIKMLYTKVESELSPRERLVLKMRYGLYDEKNIHSGKSPLSLVFLVPMCLVLKKVQ